jgi:hypothetical protein
MAIRWTILALICVVLLGVGFVVEHELVSMSRRICPPGWWRESPGICAFAPVFILTKSFAYALQSIFLLIAVALLAPARTFQTSLLLLAVLALVPAYDLIFGLHQWIALLSLASVLTIAACFCLGARTTGAVMNSGSAS